MNRQNLSKIFSTSLSLALMATSIPMPASAVGAEMAAPSFVSKFTPSEKFGYVSSSYAPNGETKPRLIVIADLHGHVEVQKNIMGMLRGFVDSLQSGKKVPIFLEGGWTPNLEEPLSTVKNQTVRGFLDQYLLHKSELSAGQAYSEEVAGSNKVTLIGVENEGEYKRNKEVFVKTYPARKALIIALRREEKAIKKLSGAISNSSFLSLQKSRDDYNAGKIQPEQFARLLSRQARRFGIAGKYVDVLQNASTSSTNDLDVAFNVVYNSVSMRIAKARPMSAFLRQSIGNEQDIRQKIALVDSQLDLLKRLVGNQLTPAEVPLAMAQMAKLVQIAEMLVPPGSVAMNVGDVVRDSLAFYPYAMVRNESLVKNSLASLDKMGTDTTGILIVGGFHAQAIDDYLRDHRISYMQVNPTITRDLSADEQLNYIKRLCNDHVTPAELSSDLESLRNGGATRLASAAVGPTTFLSDTPQKTPGEPPVGEKLANGITPGQLAVLDADKVAINGAFAALDTTASQAVTAADAAAEDVQRVLNLANAERAKQQKEPMSASMFTQVVHVDRGLDGKFRENGSRDDADNAAYILNQALGQLAAANAGAHIHAMNVAFVDDVNAVGAGAAILGVHEGHGGVPLLVMQRQRGQAILKMRDIQEGIKNGKIKADDPAIDAVMRAIGDFAHEVMGHAFNPNGKVEASALPVGAAHAVALAVNNFAGLPGMGTAQEIAERALRAINKEFADVVLQDDAGKDVSAWDLITPGLAKMIVVLVGGPQVLNEQEVQEAIVRIQQVLPITEFQARQAIERQSSRLHELAIYYSNTGGKKDDEENKVDNVVKNVEGDAQAIEEGKAGLEVGEKA